MASSTTTETTAEIAGRRSTRSRMADHTRDSVRAGRRRRRNGIRTRPFSTCRPSSASIAGSAVSEPSIATATTMIVPTANDVDPLSPVRNCPAIADHHGEAGDQDRATRGGRCDLDRAQLVAACASFFTLALEVEERVVDADSHADQRDHDRGVVVDREDVAGNRDQADGGDHGRDCQQHGHAGSDQRAEGDDQDDQRHGQRQRLGPLQVVLDRLVDLGADAGIAELLDAQLGVLPSGRRGWRLRPGRCDRRRSACRP